MGAVRPENEGRNRSQLLTLAFAVVIVIAPIGLWFRGADPQVLWIVVIACTAAAVLTRYADVENFELGPLKARLNKETERARQAADMATATVKQVQELAGTLTRPLLATTMAQGRLAGGDLRARQLAILDDVEKQLRDLGLSSDQVRRATSDFYQFVGIDLVHDLQRLTTANGKNVEAQSSLNKCFEGFIREDLSLGDISALRRCLECSISITDEIHEALADLEHFRTSGNLRRRSIYVDRRRKREKQG